MIYIPGKRNFSIVYHKNHCLIVHYFDFYIHLAITGILNFQNRTFLVEVMPCFIKLEKSEFWQMRLSQKMVNSVMCQHQNPFWQILRYLFFFFFLVLFLFLFCVNRIKCLFCFNSFTRPLLWWWIWILPWHEVCHFKCWHRFMWCW